MENVIVFLGFWELYATNEENLDNFSVDLKNTLKVAHITRNNGLEIIYYDWIDDDKHKLTLEINFDVDENILDYETKSMLVETLCNRIEEVKVNL